MEKKLKEIQEQFKQNSSKKTSISKGLVKGRAELAKTTNKLVNLEKEKKDYEKSLREI